MKFTEAEAKTYGRLYGIVGHLGPWKVITDKNIVTQNGWEYIRVPRTKCSLLWWFTKTIKIANMEPSTVMHIVKETNSIYMHPDMLETFKKQCEKDDISEKIKAAERSGDEVE